MSKWFFEAARSATEFDPAPEETNVITPLAAPDATIAVADLLPEWQDFIYACPNDS